MLHACSGIAICVITLGNANMLDTTYAYSCKKQLFGQVKGLRPPGRPRSSFNDVALQDCQTHGINRLYKDAQDRLLWKNKTCPACT